MMRVFGVDDWEFIRPYNCFNFWGKFLLHQLPLLVVVHDSRVPIKKRRTEIRVCSRDHKKGNIPDSIRD